MLNISDWLVLGVPLPNKPEKGLKQAKEPENIHFSMGKVANDKNLKFNSMLLMK